MNQIYIQSIYKFRKIDPKKKYSSFDFFTLHDIKEFGKYLFDGAIIKHREVFYEFAGIKERQTASQKQSLVEIKEGSKIYCSFYLD